MPILYRRLSAPPQQLVDAVSAFLGPKLMAVTHGPLPWLRLIFVAVARKIGVSGASAVAITTTDPDALYHAIARVTAVLLPDTDRCVKVVTDATNEVEQHYNPNPNAAPPNVTMTPVKIVTGDGDDEGTPPRQRSQSPQAQAPPEPAISTEERITAAVREIVRELSASQSRAAPPLPDEISVALRRSADMAQTSFDSHGCRGTLEERDQLDSAAIAVLRLLPRLRIARDHPKYGMFRTALDKVIVFLTQAQRLTVNDLVEKYVGKATQKSRSFSIAEASTLCALLQTYPTMDSDNARYEILCGIAEILALNAEESDLFRVVRWARLPFTDRLLFRPVPDLPVRWGSGGPSQRDRRRGGNNNKGNQRHRNATANPVWGGSTGSPKNE